MKKKSNLLAAPLLHVGQNFLTRHIYLKPRKQYLHKFIEGLTGKQITSVADSFGQGVISSTFSPEYGALLGKYKELGQKASEVYPDVAKMDLDKPLSYHGKRLLATLRKGLRGELDYDENELRPIFKEMTGGKELPTKQEMSKLLSDSSFARTAQSLFMKPAVGNKVISPITAKRATKVGKAVGLGATFSADPFAGAINAKKMFLTGDNIKSMPKPVQKAHHWAVEKFIKNPIKKTYNAGVPRKKSQQFFDEYVMSPLFRDARDAASTLGQVNKLPKLNPPTT